MQLVCCVWLCPRIVCTCRAEWSLHDHTTVEMTNQLRVYMCACAGDVLDVALSQDGVLGASCSDDFSVRVWDLEHRECLKTCKGHTGWVVSVEVGRRVAGGGGGLPLSMTVGKHHHWCLLLLAQDSNSVMLPFVTLEGKCCGWGSSWRMLLPAVGAFGRSCLAAICNLVNISHVLLST